MIITMKPGATPDEIGVIRKRLEVYGLRAEVVAGLEETEVGRRATIAVLGETRQVDTSEFQALQGVENVSRVSKPYKFVSREYPPHDIHVKVGNQLVGNGNGLFIGAGNCAVEDEGWVLETAHAVKEAGGNALRGGVFKPRTSPYSFEGLGEKGLKILAKAREQTGLPIIATEVMDSSQIPLFLEYGVDVWQIGARLMMAYPLLDMVAKATADTPYAILLKRGMDAKVEDWLLAAERLWKHGNPRIILCERGIRTFETETRNTPDPVAVAAVRYWSKLPVIGDPTHSTGKREYAAAAAAAYIAAGSHGLEIEVHPHPDRALCDGAESIRLKDIGPLFKYLKELFDLRSKSEAIYTTVR